MSKLRTRKKASTYREPIGPQLPDTTPDFFVGIAIHATAGDLSSQIYEFWIQAHWYGVKAAKYVDGYDPVDLYPNAHATPSELADELGFVLPGGETWTSEQDMYAETAQLIPRPEFAPLTYPEPIGPENRPGADGRRITDAPSTRMHRYRHEDEDTNRSLTTAHEHVKRLEHQLEDARAWRSGMIQNAINEGYMKTQVAELLGVTKQQMNKWTTQAREARRMAGERELF